MTVTCEPVFALALYGAWLLLRTRRALEAAGAKISRFSLPELYQPLFENLDQERKPEPHKSRIPPGFRGRPPGARRRPQP